MIICNEDIKMVILDKCLGNLKLILVDIHNDIVHACAIEATKMNLQDLKDSFFSLLVNDVRDITNKE